MAARATSHTPRGRRLALAVVCAATLREPLRAGPAGALLAPSVRRQATGSRPLLPLAVLRNRVVAGVNAAHALMVGAMFGFQFLMTLYLQRVLGFSAAEAGLG